MCRISCGVCRWNRVILMSFHSCPPLPPTTSYFFLKTVSVNLSIFFRTVAKSGVECCWRHSAGVDLFWGTPLEILICPKSEWHTGVAAWTVCKLAQEAEKPCGRYRNIFRSTEVPPGLFSKNEAPVWRFFLIFWGLLRIFMVLNWFQEAPKPCFGASWNQFKTVFRIEHGWFLIKC